MIQGSPDHGMDENCAPNPLEGFTDPETLIKKSKGAKDVPYFPVCIHLDIFISIYVNLVFLNPTSTKNDGER